MKSDRNTRELFAYFGRKWLRIPYINRGQSTRSSLERIPYCGVWKAKEFPSPSHFPCDWAWIFPSLFSSISWNFSLVDLSCLCRYFFLKTLYTNQWFDCFGISSAAVLRQQWKEGPIVIISLLFHFRTKTYNLTDCSHNSSTVYLFLRSNQSLPGILYPSFSLMPET